MVIGTLERAMTPQIVLHFLRVTSGRGHPVTGSTLSTTQLPSGMTEGFLGRRCVFAEDVVGVADPDGDGEEEG